jgi:hypothetical protein
MYTGITWNPDNRARHEARYPDRPRFTAAELADWSRIYRRVDVEHPKPGKSSLQALVGRRVVGADLVTRIAVYFVAYTRSRGILEIVSIRFAGSEERAIFFR